MTIKTKFDIGEKVWVVIDTCEGVCIESVEVDTIECIFIRNKQSKLVSCFTLYTVDGLDYRIHNKFYENELFRTKEEALKKM